MSNMLQAEHVKSHVATSRVYEEVNDRSDLNGHMSCLVGALSNKSREH